MKSPLIFLCLFLLTVAFVQAEYEIRVEDDQCELVQVVDGKALVVRSLFAPKAMNPPGAEVIGVSESGDYDYVLYRCGVYVLLDKVFNGKTAWERPACITKGAINFTRFDIKSEDGESYVLAYKGETLVLKASCGCAQLIFEFGRNRDNTPGVPDPDK